jgi:hypothetical protein
MRDTIARLPGSKIREVANAGLGRSDVLAFWFGESDEVTPEAVRDAAARSLAAGETFYSHNLGLPELREALAGYCSALHGAVDVERIAVTSSGVNALMLAMQMLVDAGDEVVAVVPLWPNLTAQPAILGARVRASRCARYRAAGRWTWTAAARRDAGHPRAAGQRTEQPHRLDADAGRAAGHAGALPPHRHLDRGRRGLRAPAFRRPGRRAELPGHRQRRRPPGGGAQLFQELPDDRLAPGLAGAAARPPGRHRQADRVQHVVRAGVRAARWSGGAGKMADGLRAGAGAPAPARCRDRLLAGCGAARRGGGQPAGGMYAFFRVRGAGRLAGLCQAAGQRTAWAWRLAWPSARRRGLAALVLCVARPAAPGRRGAAPGSRAWL